jgi:2-oxoglutarate ferredoxin oxidoreductase subunit gamma
MEPYDFLIVLSQEAASDVKPDRIKEEAKSGYLIWDTSTIQKFRTVKRINKAIGIPIQKIAVEKFGNIVFGNSILFGIFTVLSGIFSEESAIRTIKKFVPSSTLDKNLEAFDIGKREALKFIEQQEEVI